MHLRLHLWRPVCAENLVRFDLITESPNVDRDDRIPPVPAKLAWLALQVKELEAAILSRMRSEATSRLELGKRQQDIQGQPAHGGRGIELNC